MSQKILQLKWTKGLESTQRKRISKFSTLSYNLISIEPYNQTKTILAHRRTLRTRGNRVIGNSKGSNHRPDPEATRNLLIIVTRHTTDTIQIVTSNLLPTSTNHLLTMTSMATGTLTKGATINLRTTMTEDILHLATMTGDLLPILTTREMIRTEYPLAGRTMTCLLRRGDMIPTPSLQKSKRLQQSLRV